MNYNLFENKEEFEAREDKTLNGFLKFFSFTVKIVQVVLIVIGVRIV